jgi:hypothetical protein
MKCLLVKILALVTLNTALLFALAIPAFAASTGTPGQPNQSCQDVFPSGTLTPQGFNTSGFANADEHYAGSQPQNSNNSHSVSQYDVACFEASQHP